MLGEQLDDFEDDWEQLFNKLEEVIPVHCAHRRACNDFAFVHRLFSDSLLHLSQSWAADGRDSYLEQFAARDLTGVVRFFCSSNQGSTKGR